MAADLAEFEARFAGAKDKRASWDELCRAWPGVTREQAWRRLQRITVGTIDERSLRDVLHAYACALVAGPGDVVAGLGDFLDDHLARELTAPDVWDYLRVKGFAPTDWGRDSSVLATIHDTTSRYRAGIITDRGPLAEIRRSAANELAGLVAGPAGPAVMTVAADAGLGKTGVLGRVLQVLDAPIAAGDGAAERPVVLAARLDRLGDFRDAPSLGSALGLPGSPAAVLSRVAAGRPAVLVLDQVDAFGAGSGRNPARLDAVAETLREARALSVGVLLACRAFDLEVDPRLAELAGPARSLFSSASRFVGSGSSTGCRHKPASTRSPRSTRNWRPWSHPARSHFLSPASSALNSTPRRSHSRASTAARPSSRRTPAGSPTNRGGIVTSAMAPQGTHSGTSSPAFPVRSPT